MGLYDNYKLNNSSYISQFVGSIVPELQDFSKVMKQRYDEARDTDDALVEAMGNLQHLDTEEDTTYANELKQNYLNRVMDRSGREDYENMGRRTQRDARGFSSDYVPLVNRMKGMQSIQERVLQDEKIFAPETKQKIMGVIRKRNSMEKDEAGNFERDPSGKIKLGAIQDWAYAKDVDINKKLADFLDKKAADLNQTGYRRDGQGLMISQKREFRDPVEIGKLANEMMKTDPEIRAMIERDVELATYNYSPAEFTELANQNNTSLYDKMIRVDSNQDHVKVALKQMGVTLEEAKIRPADKNRMEAKANGEDLQAADRAYVRSLARQQIMSPHSKLVADLLGIDRRSIEAREDPDYAARVLGATLGAVLAERDRSESIPIQSAGQNIEAVNIPELMKQDREVSESRKTLEHDLQNYLGEMMGTLPPNMNKADIQRYYTNTSELLNNKVAQADLLAKLGTSDPAKARDIQMALDKYKTMSNQTVQAGIVLEQVKASTNIDDIYSVYAAKQKALGEKSLDKQTFQRALDSKATPTSLSYKIFGTGGDKLEDYRRMYTQKLQTKADEMIKGKTLVTGFTGLEPISGKIVKQTDALEVGVKNGSLKIEATMTGEKSLDEILARKYKYGPLTWDNSDIDTDAELAEVRKNLRVRWNTRRTADGRLTGTISFPDGTSEVVTLTEVPPSYGNGMLNEFYGSAAGMMSRSEAQHWMETATVAAGSSKMTIINEAQLATMGPTSGQAINETYGVKITEAGIGKEKDLLYQLMIKNPRTGRLEVAPSLKSTTDYHVIMGLIGQPALAQDWPADGPGVFNPTK